ncbi:MAG TPA: hypothetical protein DCE41_16615 [Cytophagales bacterium]|nr:hypothetical protein [Cytophagales bacterium]
MRSILLVVAMVSLGLLLGYFLGSQATGQGEGNGEGTGRRLLVLLALFPVSYYAAILLHELGHLVMGLAQKFSFAYLMVGPVILRKVEKRYSFQRNRGFNLLGGFTVMLFPQEGDLRKKMIPYVAGGPLATLFTGLLAWWGFQQYGGMSGLSNASNLLDTLIVGFLGFYSLFSGFLLFLALYPRRSGLVQTDGARLLTLLSAKGDNQLEFLYYAHYQSSFGGTHPRDYDRELLEKVAADEDESGYGPFAHLSLYLMELALGKVVEAEGHLQLAREGVADQNPFISQAVEYEHAFFQALWGDAVSYTDELWPAKQRTILEPGTKARYLAARYWKKGELDKAQEQIILAKKALPHHLDQGFAKIELEWLAMLEEQISPAEA